MANELNIGVKFGAEGIPEVTKSISQLDAQLKRFRKGLNDATGVESIARLNRAIDVTKQRMEALRKFTGDAGGALGSKVTVGANQATNALTNLSRIAQDAPFGFIGITNNINPLLESFQRLKAETGSSGTALKALGSSLLGAGGLGLAVGIGSALLTVFGDKLFGIGAASKKAKDDADELARTIRDIGTVQAEATGGVQGQIAQVQSLAAAVADSNRPYGERKRALEELKDINKAYFGDLKLEDIATGKLTKTVEEYNKALVANAVVKGFVDEIANVSKAAAVADSDLAKATTRLANAEKALALARATGRPTGREGTGQSQEEVKANEQLIDAFKEQRSQRDKLLELETQRAVLFDRLNKAQAEALKFKDTEVGKTEKEVDLLAKRLAALEKIKDVTKDLTVLADLEEQIFDLKVKITLRDAAKNGLSKEETDLAIKGFRDQLNEAFEKETLSLEAIPKVKFSRVELAPFTQQELDALISGTKIQEALSGIASKTKEIKIKSDRQVKIELLGIEFVLAEEEAKKAVERLKETIVNGAIDTLASTADAFGQALADAFSGKGIGEAFAKGAQTILGTIGGVLQEVGKQVIATSTLIKALRAALDKLFLPGGASAGIVAGLALVALGGLLKNIKIPGFASGVNNFSGGLAIVGERGPELVNLPRGSDVIPNHMLGGSTQPIILQPSLKFSGKDMYVTLQRVTESNRTVGGGTL